MKNEKKEKSAANFTPDFSTDSSIDTDPNGSYTGVPNDKYEKPVQDADDL